MKSFEGEGKEEQSYGIEELVEHHGLLKQVFLGMLPLKRLEIEIKNT